jgi:hypothetical protein
MGNKMERNILVSLLLLVGLSVFSCASTGDKGGTNGGSGGQGDSQNTERSGAPEGMVGKPEVSESTELLLRLDSLLREEDKAIRVTDEQKAVLIPLLENWLEKQEQGKIIKERDVRKVEAVLTDIQLICRVLAPVDSDSPSLGNTLLERVLAACGKG